MNSLKEGEELPGEEGGGESNGGVALDTVPWEKAGAAPLGNGPASFRRSYSEA
ncbi:MAG: hypothetical protein ACKOF3_12490 [Spartobacteria bacterium]